MLARAQRLTDRLIAWRRDIHTHPELGFKEIRTAKKVADVLNTLGYQVRVGVGKTGVIAQLGDGKPVIGIRADMDALPIQETNDLPYASHIPGLMHACGHDAHTTIALGVALLLSKEKFNGTLRLIFQPAEEVADYEGISGAPRMIADGAIEGMDKILALHVDPFTLAGHIALHPGIASAGVDTFFATILGKGGHGAMPQDTVDPIFISGHVILAIHGIISRRLYPFDPAVISIGSIHGGFTDNVIPEQVDLIGTIRFMDAKIQQTLHQEIEKALSIARSLGSDYRLRIEIGYPPLINDSEVIEALRKVAIDLLGEGCIQVRRVEMGAEDFSFMTAQVPGAMFSLGCGNGHDVRRLHSSNFDIDERCLPIGVAILAETAIRYLNNE